MRRAGKRRRRGQGFATEYFLRQLAQARSRPWGEGASREAGAARAYSKALAESIVLLVLMPSIALFCLIASIGARAGAATPTSGLAWLLLVFLIVGAFVLLGHLWLGHRLQRFRHDHSPAQHYDSARDRRIVFWQKLIVTSVCGGVVPLSLLWLIAHP